MQPSSALRLACSHALAARAASTVPPSRPSGPAWDAVSHVLTTTLVPASSRYAADERYVLWIAFSSVVVDTCCCPDAWPRAPGTSDASEYMDIRAFAIAACVGGLAREREGRGCRGT